MKMSAFPTFEVGHFYKLKIGATAVVAFCQDASTFVVMAGSVIDSAHWPSCLEPGYKEPSWGRVADELVVSGCADKLQPGYLITFIKNYDSATPLELAQLATGREDVDAASLWTNVF